VKKRTRIVNHTSRHSRAFTAFLCALALLMVTPAVPSDELLDQGAELQRQGKLKEAVELFSAMADVGDPVGAYGLGVVYFQGRGVPKDMVQSTHWFGISAVQGYAPAQYNLGNAYLHGRGVAKNLDQAEQWWRKAAQQGYTRAQYNLGALLHGSGATADMREEGIAWIRAAAADGFDKAVNKLAEIGQPVDYAKGGPDTGSEILRSEARLMTFDPQHFTIQLLSGSKPDSAQAYILGQGLAGDALSFRFFRDGQTWSAVVLGQYKTRAEATSAVSGLRPELKNAKPWIRSLADVQEKIQQVWGSDAAPKP